MSILSSLKVLDFSTLLTGPYASMMLADMGAEVVRVEAPNRPDMARYQPPFKDGVSAPHAYVNRSKRSVALDLKRHGAAEVVKRLVQTYDVILEQFRPGVMDRIGIGHEALAAENPRLIYCALTSYGRTGPMRDRAGHDINHLSLAGVMSYSGRREGGPVAQGVQIADLGAGSFMALIGILAGVVHRQRTSEGQFVDVSMFDGSLLWNAYAAAEYLVGGIVPGYESNRLNGGSHYDYFRTKDGRYLSVGSNEEKFWVSFCEGIDRPDLIGRRTTPGPPMEPVRAEMRRIIAGKTLAEWVEVFRERDACVEPVLDVAEALAHPQTQAREMVVDVPKGNGGVQRQIGSPFKFSKSRAEYRHVGAALGAHTREVLREAGYTDRRIEALKEEGVFGDVDV